MPRTLPFFSGLIDDVRIYNKALSAEEIAALAQ
ncbi:MAG: LamG-like jellyroll fold domain-containing protein [Sedimentisphaerales bacterium]